MSEATIIGPVVPGVDPESREGLGMAVLVSVKRGGDVYAFISAKMRESLHLMVQGTVVTLERRSGRVYLKAIRKSAGMNERRVNPDAHQDGDRRETALAPMGANPVFVHPVLLRLILARQPNRTLYPSRIAASFLGFSAGHLTLENGILQGTDLITRLDGETCDIEIYAHAGCTTVTYLGTMEKKAIKASIDKPITDVLNFPVSGYHQVDSAADRCRIAYAESIDGTVEFALTQVEWLAYQDDALGRMDPARSLVA